jgi:uncharacterized protein YjbJ (UPF0337 family)
MGAAELSAAAQRASRVTTQEPTPRIEESTMAGETDKISGTVKEKVGSATGNDRLEGEGAGQKHAGKVEDALHGAKEKVTGVADAIKDKLHSDKSHQG